MTVKSAGEEAVRVLIVDVKVMNEGIVWEEDNKINNSQICKKYNKSVVINMVIINGTISTSSFICIWV